MGKALTIIIAFLGVGMATISNGAPVLLEGYKLILYTQLHLIHANLIQI